MANVGFGDFGDTLSGEKTLLALFKEFLGIDPGDATQDDELNQALNMAGDAIETYLDRAVVKRTLTEYFRHHFGTVELHDYPVAIDTPPVVTLDGATQTDYQLWLGRGQVGQLSRLGRRPDMPMDWRAYNQVTVAYEAGYDPIPSDLANAIIYTASLIYQSNGTGNIPGGGGSGEVKSMSIYDVGSISYDVGSSSSGSGSGYFAAAGLIPDTAAQMVMRYKRVSA